jgi:hypothetical protein
MSEDNILQFKPREEDSLQVKMDRLRESKARLEMYLVELSSEDSDE